MKPKITRKLWFHWPTLSLWWWWHDPGSTHGQWTTYPHEWMENIFGQKRWQRWVKRV